MRKFLMILTLFGMFMFGAPLFAQDTPTAEAPAVTAPAEASANWFESNIHLIGTIFMAILSGLGVWGKLREKAVAKLGEDKTKIIEGSLSAVTEVYQEYVKDIKAGKSSGGKLTKEEAAEARKRATDKIKGFAKSEGINIAKTIGKAALPSLIEKAVNAMKGSAKGAK